MTIINNIFYSTGQGYLRLGTNSVAPVVIHNSYNAHKKEKEKKKETVVIPRDVDEDLACTAYAGQSICKKKVALST